MNGDSPGRKKEHKQCASGFKYSLTITTIQPVNIYKKVLQQCQGQSLDKTNCNMLNAYFMIKKCLVKMRPLIEILETQLIKKSVLKKS